MNIYDCVTVFVTKDRLWKFFISRDGSNRVEDGGMHAGSSFDPTNSTGTYAVMGKLRRPVLMECSLGPSTENRLTFGRGRPCAFLEEPSTASTIRGIRMVRRYA